MHYDSVCHYKKRLQIILCITLKELEKSLIKYEYNLIVLPCPGSSFLVIKTRRVTFNVLMSTWVDLKKNQFFSQSAQSKRKEYIGYFYGTNQKINNNNNNHSLTTSLKLPVKHNQMEQRYPCK